MQTVATAVQPATTPVGAGTLHIELGTWGTGQTSFTPKAGATAVDVVIAATDTLSDVRDKINAAGAGVTAMIMTDASGSRLLMRSSATGADSGFRTSGIASLAFDPSAGVTTMTQTQAAANAAATVNGLAVTSPSNTLANIVDGLTLTLNAVTTTPVNVNVATDTTTLKKTITDFAAAYTAVNKLHRRRHQVRPDGQDRRHPPGRQRRGRPAAPAAHPDRPTSGASATFPHLSDIGLQMQTDGSLTVNGSVLDNALNNVAELKKAFSNSNILDPTQDGFGKRFRVIADSLLGVDGVADDAHRRPGQAAAAQPERPGRAQRPARRHREARMRAQYTALDTVMAQLNGQSSYITQQLAAFNNCNSK